MREQSGAATLYRIYYPYLVDSMRTQATALVGEDFYDCTIYTTAARAFVSCHPDPDLHGAQLNLRPHHGGGHRTSDVFLARAKESPTVCVVDSDRKTPNGALGTTASALGRVAGETVCALCVQHVLPCQELENLLPVSLLQAAIMTLSGERHPQQVDGVKRIEGLALAGLLASGPPLWFFDLKGDHQLRSCLLEQEPETREFIRDVFERIKPHVAAPAEGWCQTQPTCRNENQCKCKFPRGLPKNALRLVAAYMAARPLEEVAAALFSEQAEEVRQAWRIVCERVFSWGCALKAQSS